MSLEFGLPQFVLAFEVDFEGQLDFDFDFEGLFDFEDVEHWLLRIGLMVHLELSKIQLKLCLFLLDFEIFRKTNI